MKKRVKLLTTIASLCLAVALMAFGVYAASNINVTVNSTISFTSSDIAGKWDVKVEGAGTLAETTVTDATNSTEPTVEGDEDVALTFSRTQKTATYTITFTNTGTAVAAKTNLTVTLTDTTANKAFSYEVKMDDADYAADNKVEVNNDTVVYVVTVTLDDSKLSAEELANGFGTDKGVKVVIQGTAVPN